MRRWGVGSRPDLTYHMRGVPDEEIGMVMDCRGVADRVVAGLLEHKSQHHVILDDPSETDRWEAVVRRLWFEVVWPARPAGSQMLSGVFEGLP